MVNHSADKSHKCQMEMHSDPFTYFQHAGNIRIHSMTNKKYHYFVSRLQIQKKWLPVRMLSADQARKISDTKTLVFCHPKKRENCFRFPGKWLWDSFVTARTQNLKLVMRKGTPIIHFLLSLRISHLCFDKDLKQPNRILISLWALDSFSFLLVQSLKSVASSSLSKSLWASPKSFLSARQQDLRNNDLQPQLLLFIPFCFSGNCERMNSNRVLT